MSASKVMAYAVIANDGLVREYWMCIENAESCAILRDMRDPEFAPHRIIELVERDAERERAVGELVAALSINIDANGVSYVHGGAAAYSAIARLKELDRE